MHMLIYGLVHADSQVEALATAKSEIFTPLVDRGTFDSYATMDAAGRSVAAMWEDYPIVAEADSVEGQKLIEDGWQSTVADYRESFDQVEAFVDAHDRSDFWEDGDVHREFHYAFHTIGEFEGTHTYLYDDAGQGIRDRDHLRMIETAYADLVDETTDNPYLDRTLYVVPGVVQY